MTFIKKQAAGFYLCTLALIFAIVAVIFYNVNCNTSYFANLGVSPVVLGCTIAALVLEAAILVGSQLKPGNKLVDLCFVAVSVLLVVAFAAFVTSRVNGIASIMTFENNAKTMADLSSAIVGMAAYLLAVVVSIVSSFCRVCKE